VPKNPRKRQVWSSKPPNATELAALSVSAQPAPAVFAWDMDPEYVDVPFPDFSYWGHEVDRFRGPGGESGLRSQVPSSLSQGCHALSHAAMLIANRPQMKPCVPSMS
jgi:hypothetical protein